MDKKVEIARTIIVAKFKVSVLPIATLLRFGVVGASLVGIRFTVGADDVRVVVFDARDGPRRLSEVVVSRLGGFTVGFVYGVLEVVRGVVIVVVVG